MKVIGLIFIVAASSSVGFGMALSIQKERNLLLQMQRALQILRNEIAFCGTPLPQAFALVAAACSGYLECVFSDAAKQMDKHRWMTPACVMEQVMSNHRETAVSEILQELAAGLGNYDLQAQLDSICNADVRAAELLQKTEQDGKAKAKIYETLGICGGLSVAILLI